MIYYGGSKKHIGHSVRRSFSTPCTLKPHPASLLSSLTLHCGWLEEEVLHSRQINGSERLIATKTPLVCLGTPAGQPERREMDTQWLAKFAVPAVAVLVAFLSYSSQYLFSRTEPGLLTFKQQITFNALLGCLWISYARACWTDPGRVALDWKGPQADGTDPASPESKGPLRQRYCRKCEGIKAPRSHHCKVCKRYAIYLQLSLTGFLTLSDVSQRWTIIVHGREIAYPTSRSLISYDSCGMRYHQCATWNTSCMNGEW